MAFRFGDGSWADAIAKESTKPEYQTATIALFPPSTVPGVDDYDFETGELKEEATNTALYSGQARIIGVRWGTFTQGDAQENSTTLKSVRVQVTKDGLGRIEHGSYVHFVSVPGNPALESRVLTVTSDFQGGSSASRTFECAVDSDSVASDG